MTKYHQVCILKLALFWLHHKSKRCKTYMHLRKRQVRLLDDARSKYFEPTAALPKRDNLLTTFNKRS